MISPVDTPPEMFGSRSADPGLDPAEIARAADLPVECVEVVESIDSTNRELMERPREGLRSPATLLLAERQVAGRGRQGRSFVSDPRDSLTFSVALIRARSPDAPPLTGLPLVLGIAVAEVASRYAGGIGLKWPNDLQRDGRKCSGMLIETRTAADHDRVVIGLGLNLRMPAELAARIDQPATGLFEGVPDMPPRSALAGEFGRALIDAARRFFVAGFEDTARRWARFDVLAGREVTILERGAVVLSGRADGLDPTGALRVLTPGGAVSVAVGDVSVRPVDRSRGGACGA